MTKLTLAIPILTAPLLLMGCEKKYDTLEECNLEELKKLDQTDDSAVNIVLAYCVDYIEKIDKEEERRETEQDGQSTEVRLVADSKWEIIPTKKSFFKIDLNSIEKITPAIRRATIISAVSEKEFEDGDYARSMVEFDCFDKRIWPYRVDFFKNSKFIEEDNSYSYRDVAVDSSAASTYNFVCSHQINH
jgi:hypothetical protein